MIMIISGTGDGRELTELLLKEGYQVMAATATKYGAELMHEHENLKRIAGRMNHEQIKECIMNNKILMVIDATHPYAEEISINAMIACDKTEIPYYRYERENSSNIDSYPLIYCNSYEDAANVLLSSEGNVLLSTGSKSLKVFTDLLGTNRLFPRVLPNSEIIRKCEELGFSPSNIIAMQGPFSEEMNVEIIKKYSIKLLVTKESGYYGGTLAKLKAAKKMNIRAVMIRRPQVSYPNAYGSKEELVLRVRETYEKILSHNA